MKTAKGSDVRRAVLGSIIVGLAVAAILVSPSAPAEPAGSVRVLNKNSSYDREVIAGERASAEWTVYNSGNISSYNVQASVVGSYGTWELSVAPQTFTITPDSVQEVSVHFASRKSNLGESHTIVVRFNITEISGGGAPESYELEKTVAFTVVARQVIDENGLTVLGFHTGLPGFMDNDWGRFALMVVIWIIVGAAAVGVIQFLKWIASKTETKYDDIVLDIVRVPTMVLVVLYGLVNSLSHVRLDAELLAWTLRLYYIGLILVLAYVGYKIFKGVLIVWMKDIAKKTDTELDDILVPIFDKIGTVVILIVAVIFLLNYLGVNVTVFVAGLGVAGLVVAFAAQDTLSNFFAGIFLLVDRPFSIGDTIIVENGDYCEVLHVGLRSTRLYDIFTSDMLVIPNNKLANMNIVNVSKPDKREKVTMEIGVAYDSELEKVEAILLEITGKHPNIDRAEESTPVVRLSSFGENGAIYRLFFTVDDWNNRWRVAHELRKEILARFAKDGIKIPYPQRVVHMKRE
jgi:MscS family membrane protein